MNVEFTCHAVKFSHTFSVFVDVRCREQSGILLRGPDRKKPDRLAASQSVRFARIPDRQKIMCVNILLLYCIERVISKMNFRRITVIISTKEKL